MIGGCRRREDTRKDRISDIEQGDTKMENEGKDRSMASVNDVENKCIMILDLMTLCHGLHAQTPKSLCTHCFLEELLAGRNEHALSVGVVSPSARSCFTAMLLGICFDSLLQFGSEVSY